MSGRGDRYHRGVIARCGSDLVDRGHRTRQQRGSRCIEGGDLHVRVTGEQLDQLVGGTPDTQHRAGVDVLEGDGTGGDDANGVAKSESA